MNKKNKIIQIIGAPGSGKDYIAKGISKELEDINISSFSEILMDKLRGVRDLSEKDQLGILEYNLKEKVIMDGVDEVIKNQPFVLNTHNIYRIREGEYKFSIKYDKILNSMAYIHLTCPPEIIMGRINKDKEDGARERQYSLEEIHLMQEVSLSFTKILSKSLESNLHIISNTNSNDAIKNVKELIKFYFKNESLSL